MVSTLRRFVPLLAGLSLLVTFVSPSQASLGWRQPQQEQRSSGAHHLVHVPKQHTAPLKPNHIATPQLHERNRHSRSPRHLYGVPGHLTRTSHATRGPVTHTSQLRHGGIPTADRCVPLKNHGHIRRASSGCPVASGYSCLDIGSDSPAGSIPSYTAGTGSNLSTLQMTAGGPGNDTFGSAHHGANSEGFLLHVPERRKLRLLPDGRADRRHSDLR